MLIEDEDVLAGIACLEPVTVHGRLGVINLGDTFLDCWFRWSAVRCENGIIVRERTPVLAVLRPMDSILAGSPITQWLMAQSVAHGLTEKIGTVN